MKTKVTLEKTTAPVAKKVFAQRIATVKLKIKFRCFHWQDRRSKDIVIIADTWQCKKKILKHHHIFDCKFSIELLLCSLHWGFCFYFVVFLLHDTTRAC
jgi:hypothetical protein